MFNLKPGDKVLRVKKPMSVFDPIKIYQVYTVKKVCSLSFIKLEGLNFSYYIGCFKKVKERKENPEYKSLFT